MTNKSTALFERGKRVIPGGVNSPVRAFGSVGLSPLFIHSAQGAYVKDVDGNRYLDYVGSWGPMILGHNHEAVLSAVETTARRGLSFGAPCRLEVELAELICQVTGIEMVRMVNSGTEAVMSAIRLARGYTKRDKLVKFEGCYHGHSDSLLVKAGSGAMTGGVPSSAGVPEGIAHSTLNATYNDLASVEALFQSNKGEIACVIVEPVAANMGVVPPEPGFLQGLKAICQREQALLIFDEVITGFRLALGGAAEYFGVIPDLVTYGKIIGGGMPVGAYGGRREILKHVAPLGDVYQAGTLSGNPVAMAAGLAQLQLLQNTPDLYTRLSHLAQLLAEGMRATATELGVEVTVNQIGSLCCGFFTDQPVVDYHSASQSGTKLYAKYFAGMLSRGVYLAPSQFEAMFVSGAHTEAEINDTLSAAREALKETL